MLLGSRWLFSQSIGVKSEYLQYTATSCASCQEETPFLDGVCGICLICSMGFVRKEYSCDGRWGLSYRQDWNVIFGIHIRLKRSKWWWKCLDLRARSTSSLTLHINMMLELETLTSACKRWNMWTSSWVSTFVEVGSGYILESSPLASAIIFW
jgi:hypothetical protein